MKAANLLISNDGSLRIADFGLARTFDVGVARGGDHHRKYTNCVVTRWYRPPELLLGARHYGGEVDIWGIGSISLIRSTRKYSLLIVRCVLGEMFSRRPILPGTSDLDQLERIWQLCGTPNQHTWPNWDALPGCEGVKRFNPNHSRKIKSAYERLHDFMIYQHVR
jgi:serine/threonine-protein kinase BUR1